MRRLRGWTAVVLVAGLAIGSCSDDGPDRTELPSPADLRPALLTLDDMPAGWSSRPYDPESDDNVCPAEVAGPLGLDAEPPVAGVQFVAGELQQTSFSQAVQVVPSGLGAELMPIVRDALEACDGAIFGGRTAHVSELDFPEVGGETVAYTIELGDIPIHAVYVVTGDIAIIMSAYDLAGDPIRLLNSYAERAVDKANDVLG